MATIYPRLSEDELSRLPSRAESRVYRYLRDLEFDGLEVMHSLATQTRNNKGTWVGEIDFLLFHPDFGFQVWEVKGGGITLDDDGRWWSEGHQGRHRLSTTPLEQLKKQTASIVDALGKVFARQVRLPIAPVLVFPDTATWQGQLPVLTFQPEHLLLKDEVNRLNADGIRKRFANTAFAGPNASNDLPLNKSDAELIRHRLLRPACSLVSTAVEQAEQVEDELFRLSHEQQWVLRLLEQLPRMAIYGGAGTGKSVLARLHAQDHARDNKQVLLLCFNKALAEQHRSELLQDTQEAKNIQVKTFHQLCQEHTLAAGIEWSEPSSGTGKELNVFYNQTAAELLMDALQQQPLKFDALIVDEAQDYEPLWWLPLSEMVSTDSHVTLFADPAQNLYQREFELPAELFPGMVPYPFTLFRNYRNAYEIATWLKSNHKQAAEPSEQLPSSNQAVQMLRWKTEKQQLEMLLKYINQLEQEGFGPEHMLLLTPFRPSNSATIQQFLEKKPEYTSSVHNIAAVKGLEAKVVVLLDIGASDWASSPVFEYVGASRAKVRLAIFSKQAK